jgi:lysophospholipase L1-like esterase
MGFPTLYGKAIEKATHATVTVVNDAVPARDSTQLLNSIRNDHPLREDVGRADIITITIGHNDTPWVLDNDPCDGAQSDEHANWPKYTRSCVDKTAATLRANLDGILIELDKLRAGKPTAVRVTNFYNDNEKDPLADPGGDGPSKLVVDTFSETICQVADKHHAPCADIYHAFNGPDGTDFDGTYIAQDHVHPSQAGHDLIAHVLEKLGYAPLA